MTYLNGVPQTIFEAALPLTSSKSCIKHGTNTSHLLINIKLNFLQEEERALVWRMLQMKEKDLGSQPAVAVGFRSQ